MSDPLARRRPLIRLMVLLVLLGFGLTVRGSGGAFTARITNSADTVATTTATYFTCASAAIGAPATGALFAYPFGDSNSNVATDITGNGNDGAYHAPGSLAFGVSDSTVCPRDHTTVITFNGANGYVTGPSNNNPQVFSEEIWFKTSTSGYLMGFGAHPTGQDPPTMYDRQLYVSANGYLVFDVYNGAYQHISSTASYHDNAWHHAVATLSSAGMTLYADGALVASDASITSARCYLGGGCTGASSGFWRIAWDNLTGTYDPPPAFHFTGSLTYAAAYSYALTAAQVKDHYIAGTL